MREPQPGDPPGTRAPRPSTPERQDQAARPASADTADLDAYIKRMLDDAPPLTAAQRDRLALLLRRNPRPA